MNQITPIVSLHNIGNEDIAASALRAVHSFMAHPDYPQHTKLGKGHGGICIIGDRSFFVWKTHNEWHSEYEGENVRTANQQSLIKKCDWWACPKNNNSSTKEHEGTPCDKYNWAAGTESPCTGNK